MVLHQCLFLEASLLQSVCAVDLGLAAAPQSRSCSPQLFRMCVPLLQLHCQHCMDC